MGTKLGGTMANAFSKRITAYGVSDRGRVRKLNEDAFYIDEEIGLLLVSDGMGGHDAGEVASSEVISRLREGLRGPMDRFVDPMAFNADDDGDDDTTREYVADPLIAMVSSTLEETNRILNTRNQERGCEAGSGMGATVVGFWLPVISASGVVFHVGDSRLYLFREGRLRQVTRDHSMYQQWVDFGREGDPPSHNVILQALGPLEDVVPDIAYQLIQPNDILLLCSDGLTGVLSEKAITGVLSTVRRDTLQTGCEDLIEMAKEQGSRDNITALIARVKS
ncbi:MAG: serine/threonine-protein phosphatase [Magnetococcales bacterium]|nr:serine/threonine-protein phosphatase [Magnetococcales bacterium]